MKMRVLLPLVLMAVICCFTAENAAAASYYYVHDFACDNCHKNGADMTALTGNICLNCHDQSSTSGAGLAHLRNIGGPVMTPSRSFSVDMASDALGSRTAKVGPLGAVAGSESSHNWSASDTNPAAGASAPTAKAFYGNQNLSGSMVTCARCHDPHGLAVDFSTIKANPKLLKLGVDSKDAMCVDCHTQWDRNTVANPNEHAWLTHPLEVNYASYVTDGTNRFQAFTPNLNSGMALDATGNMTCSTCHGAHFTDSDAATVDGVGQTLSVGDGRMLKGSGRLTGDKNSLCQTCHTYKSHGPTSKVGCLDCHSGHSFDQTSPNYYVLRKNITNVDLPLNSPAGVGTGNVSGLDYTSPTTEWFNAGGTGYCQNCHTIPVDGAGKHNNLAVGTAATCAACHSHDNSSGSFGGACNTCHGYAPSANTPGGPDGYAFDSGTGNDYSTSSSAFNESNTPHAAHVNGTDYRFSCDQCHPAGSVTASHAGHNSGSFQEVDFGTLTGLATTDGLVPAYAPTGTDGDGDSGTCSAVYCHSNGGARAAAPVLANPGAWQNGSFNDAIAATACDACHGNSSDTMDAPGAPSDTNPIDRSNSATHLKHLAKGYNCAVCHTSTATSSTTLATGAIGGTHVNGTADVVFDGSSLTQFNASAGVYGTDGTCQNIYCHSAGPNATVSVIPDWDLAASGQCGSCHQVNATGDTGAALTGAHGKHVFDITGPQLACNVCHTHNGNATDTNAVDHVDGFASLQGGAAYKATVCDSCHGATAAGTGVDAEPDWVTPASVNCRTCHQGTLADFAVISGPTAPAKDTFDITGHGDSTLTGAPDCIGCHDTSAGKHFDGTSGDPQLIGAAVADNTFCTSCHTSSVHYANTLTAGGTSDDALNCATCHNPHGQGMGTNTDAMILGTIGGRTVNNFTDKTLRASYWEADNSGICQVCHDPGEVTHFNRIGNEDTTHFAGNVCTSCHKHTDTPIFQPNANSCGACHDTLLATEPHLSHVNKNTFNTKIEDDRSECVLCHGTDVDFYTTSIIPTGNGSNHRNGTINVDVAVGFQADLTCTNACHTSSITDGNWGDVNGLDCTACHAQPPASGAHAKHITAGLSCTDCHGSVDSAGTHPLTHIDDVVSTALLADTDANILTDMGTALADEATVNDQAFNGGVNSFNDTTNTCSNTTCHNPSNDAGDPKSAQWGVSVASCTLCHNDTAATTPMATGSHSEHVNNATLIGDNVVCTECHTDNGINTAHRNGTLEVLAGLTYSGEVGIPTTGVGSCSTSQCHSINDDTAAPYFAYVPSPVWGDNTAADKCTICHLKPPVTGDHQSHWSALRQSNGLSCQSCHGGTATPGFQITPGGNHLNAVANVSGFNDVVAGGNYNGSAVTLSYTQGAPSSCTVSCHQVNPKTWTNAASCEACHGDLSYVGTTHTAHLDIAGSIQLDVSECVVCHGADVNGYTPTGGDGGSNTHQDGTIQLQTGLSTATAGCASACHASSAADGFWTDTNGLNCTACHNNGTNDNNIANAAPVAGAHVGHVTTQSLTCDNCHDAGTALPTDTSHISGLDAAGAAGANQGETLTNKATPIADNALVDDSSFDQAGITFDDVNNTCSNTYCHDPSNSTKTADWDTDTASCTLCHGDDQVGTKMATGTHANHLNATATFGITISCDKCHPTNVNNGHFIATTGPTTVNQAVQFGGTVITGAQISPVVDGKYSGEVALPDSGVGSCGTTVCHNNGQGGAPNNSTYTWGTTNIQNCLLCHNNMPTTGGHATHLDVNIRYGPFASTGGSTNCGLCHAANAGNVSMAGQATHINGTISFAGAQELATGAIAGDATVTVCDTCHGGTTAVNLATIGAKAVWSAGGPVACETCHGDYNQANVNGALAPVRAGTAYDNSGHGKAGVAKACVDCHNHAGDHIGYTTNRLNTIATKDYNVDPNGFCNACHTGVPNSAAHFGNTQTAGGTSDDALICVTCHDQHGQNGNQDAMIASTIQAHPVSGFTDRTLRASYGNAANNGVCQVCHDATEVLHFNRTTEELATHNAGQICTTCHSHTSTPIFKPSGCNGCHGGGTVGTNASNYWPDGNDGAAGPDDAGRHLTHMNVLAQRVYGVSAAAVLNRTTADSDQKALCEYCHAANTNDSDHGSTANLPAEVFVDKDNIRHAKSLWGALDSDAAFAAGSCSNIDCHNSKVTGTGTFGWADAGASTCTMCHSPGVAGANPTTGLHTVVNNPTEVQVHDATLGTGCVECHNSMPVIGNTAGSTHINGTFATDSAVNNDRGISASGNITVFTQAAVGTSDSCASSCHSDAGNWQRLWSKDADSVSNTVGDPRCNVCHGYLNNWRTGMTPDHSTKTAINDGTHSNCATCHVRPNAPYDVATYHDTNSTLGTPTELSAPGHAVELNDSVGYDMANGNCTNICHINDAPHTLGTSAHFPANGLAGPAADCNACHLATGGSNNLNTVGTYTFNARTGAHGKHVLSAASSYGDTVDHSTATDYDFGCALCHPANASNHQNGVLDLILDPTDAPSSIKGQNGATAAYSGGTCSAVYCHGDGVTPGNSPDFLTGTFTNPNGDYCQNCHGNQPLTGSHPKHVIGIHSDDIYDGTNAKLNEAGASGAGHGDVTTALTITCAVCHNSTVSQWFNGNNTACVSCHGTAGVATDKTVIVQADLDKSFHVNGTRDVTFAPVNPLRSKAQVRDFTPGEPELNNNWTRTNGYKAGTTSHDQGVALNTATMWTGATKNCTVTCHNGNTATWGTAGASCDLCHTQLPK